MLSKPINYEIHPDAYYCVLQVADKLGVSRDTIDREIEEGKLKAYKIRSITKVKGSDLLAYIEKCKKN